MVMEGAVHAEVYLPQCVFLLLVCLLLTRPVLRFPALLLASACLAMAVLITPSSLFLVPSLLILRPRLRDFALLSSIGGLLTVVALSGSWDDYLLSPRGLLQGQWKHRPARSSDQGGSMKSFEALQLFSRSS